MNNVNRDNTQKNGLLRQLGLFDSTMMLVGIVLGTGIYLTTGVIAVYLPSVSLILLAWIFGGLLTLAGALIYAELGAAMPEAGGQYVYLREAYGTLSGFLYGWILFLGTLILTVLYLLMNYIYFKSMPLNELSGVLRIAEKTSGALFGGATTGLISAAVLISIFGALNGSIFAGPRVIFAMGNDGLFFKKVGEVHPRFKTPAFAIITMSIWSCVLTVTGTFEQLFTYVMFVALVFWVTAAASIFTLRKKFPELHRPYKTWGYPVVPIIFIIAIMGILINTLIEKPVESIAGIGILIIGIPVYYYWKSKS